jgi:hypothetical protein
MLLAGEEKNFKDLEFSVSDLYNNVKISEPGVFNNLKEVFINEFERLGLNETEYTKEEAIEEIYSEEDYDDEWYLNNVFDFGELETETKEVSEFWIEKYRKEHFKPREISLDVVEYAIKYYIDWKDIKRNAGAKIRNLEIGALAIELSSLQNGTIYLISWFVINKSRWR